MEFLGEIPQCITAVENNRAGIPGQGANYCFSETAPRIPGFGCSLPFPEKRAVSAGVDQRIAGFLKNFEKMMAVLKSINEVFH